MLNFLNCLNNPQDITSLEGNQFSVIKKEYLIYI